MQIEYNRPWVYPKQAQAIFAPLDCNGNPARYSFIEASTKTGKTIGCVVWLYEQALEVGKLGRNFWWVAPVFGQAQIAFNRMKRAVDPRTVLVIHHGDLAITLVNGAVIRFLSGEKPDNLYGEDVWAVVLDEASRMREEAWFAVRSTLTATRGPVRVIGNVKGKRNWFYRMARRAEAGEPARAYYRIIAADAVAAGILEADEIEEARRDLPEAVFRELYHAEPSDDEGNPFGERYIRACIQPALSTLPPVAWGWDLAKGGKVLSDGTRSGDWTVGCGLDRNGHLARFHRFQLPWKETIERIQRETGRQPACVDATGVGDPIVETLSRDFGSNYEGFKYTAPSKQMVMEGLAVAIQSQSVGFPEGRLEQELLAFEYVYTRTGVLYSAPEGYHDDCVCALAQAWRAKTQNRGIETWEALGRASPRPPPQTPAQRAQQISRFA